MEYLGFTYKYIYIHTYTHLHNQGFLWEYSGDMVGHISIPYHIASLRGPRFGPKNPWDRSDAGTAAQQGMMVKPPTASNFGIFEGDLDQHHSNINGESTRFTSIYCSQQVVSKIENKSRHKSQQGCFRRKMNCGFLGSPCIANRWAILDINISNHPHMEFWVIRWVYLICLYLRVMHISRLSSFSFTWVFYQAVEEQPWVKHSREEQICII